MRPDDHRRKWDRAEFEQKARDRINAHKTTKQDEEGMNSLQLR